MNVLFLTLVRMDDLNERGIYHDLMNEFSSHGHNLYIVSPAERRTKTDTSVKAQQNVKFLRVKTLNIKKTNFIEKGLATLSVQHLFLWAIKKHFKNVTFDLVMYATPPITFTTVVHYFKNRDNAKTYLLLKDIFPQNAVDMKMLRKKGLLYQYFRKKEKSLYKISDRIGCMSPANLRYLLTQNPQLPTEKVEINPNTINPISEQVLTNTERDALRKKFNLPENRTIFLYGGNLGIPQGVDFIIETLDRAKNDYNKFFVIVGNGTEYAKLEKWFQKCRPENARLLSGMPKPDYDRLVKVCDVGMIFLHKDFTIPNFPSRLLTYLEFGLPVLVAADPNTDVGEEVEKNRCGYSLLAGDLDAIQEVMDRFCKMKPEEYQEMKKNARQYLEREFLVNRSYKAVMNIF